MRKCHYWRPCKRKSCEQCMKRHRQYFVEMGEFYTIQRGLNLHATISWLKRNCNDDPHIMCVALAHNMSKALSGKIGPFIRVTGIGRKKGTPHLHYLVRYEVGELLKSRAEQHSPPGSIVWKDKKVVYDHRGILGYLFDQNFTLAALDPERIKGMRLISGSRGMTYGYPRKKHWEALQKIQNTGGNFL